MTDRGFFVEGVNGTGVLLVHGLTGAPGEMKYLARKLNRAGFSVACPQLAGHGEDEAALLTTTWKDWLHSLEPALDQLRRRSDRVAVAGICVGGALGLLLARAHCDINAAAVYSMTFNYDGWNMSRWYSASAHLLRPIANLPVVRNISFAEPYPFGLKDARLRAAAADAQANLIDGALDRLPMGSLYQMFELGQHLERVGSDIRTPTLILHAREDDMSAPANAYRLRDALGGFVEVRLLDDSYHMIHVDQERDLVADLTAQFILRQRSPAPDPGERAHV